MKELFRANKKNVKFMIVLFLVFLMVSIIIATAIGAVKVPYIETVKIILNNMGIGRFDLSNKGFEAIIFHVRLPRVIVAILVGGALGISGAVMQSMFRNPMADPGVLGVSSGASLGAIIAVALGLTSRGIYYMPLFAVIGALIASYTIYKLAASKGKVPPLILILAGIAISTFLGSITSLILTKIGEHQVREYLFWSIGSLADRRWEHASLVALPIVIFSLILMSFAKELNILLLGDEEAKSLGLNTNRIRKKILFFCSMTTAMAVCVSGNIAFVGLIVPHILRLIVGSDNRILIPLSAIGGAIFLVVCDLIARTVISPAEIGVGIITSLIGAPYFIFLLKRAQKEGISL